MCVHRVCEWVTGHVCRVHPGMDVCVRVCVDSGVCPRVCRCVHRVGTRAWLYAHTSGHRAVYVGAPVSRRWEVWAVCACTWCVTCVTTRERVHVQDVCACVHVRRHVSRECTFMHVCVGMLLCVCGLGV